MIELWRTGEYDYKDLGLMKPVHFTEEFLQSIANDTKRVDVTEEHSDKIIGSLENFEYKDGVLYCSNPSELDINGRGLSPVFNCDFVDKGNYFEPVNYAMTSIGLTDTPRSNILYNNIQIENKEMDKVSDELHKMLDKKEETIAEQREEIGVLNKQLDEMRKKIQESEAIGKDLAKIQKDFEELKLQTEKYKVDADKLHEQEAKQKKELIKEIVGEDEKGIEMFQKHSVEELQYMRDTKIITEPNKGASGGGVDTLDDGDGDDNPQQVDEYSPEYFAKWEKENTHW